DATPFPIRENPFLEIGPSLTAATLHLSFYRGSYGDDWRPNPTPAGVTRGLQTARRCEIPSRRSPPLHDRRPNATRQHRPARVDRAHRRSSWHRARALLLHAARAYSALVIATAGVATCSRSAQFHSILRHRMSCRSGSRSGRPHGRVVA